MKDNNGLARHAAMSEHKDSSVRTHPVFDVSPVFDRVNSLVLTDLPRNYM